MKPLNRVGIYFDRVDSAYSTLYEKHLAFEENPCSRTSEELKQAIGEFKDKFFAYKYMIRDLYFKN
jgi:hypothetical protein